MKESELVTKIKNYLKNQGDYVEKIWGGGFQAAGIPDIIACHRGVFVGIEVKVGKNKPSEIQLAKINQINRAGGYGKVVWSLQEVKDLIKLIDKTIDENNDLLDEYLGRQDEDLEYGGLWYGLDE